MTDVQPLEEMPKPYQVASISTRTPTGAQNVDEEGILANFKFTYEDIEITAVAMMQQGPWFMGYDVRSPETAYKVARDLYIALEMLGIQIKPNPNPLTPVQDERITTVRAGHDHREWQSQHQHGAVTGQAGNSR